MIWRWKGMGTVASTRSTRLAERRQPGWERGESQQIRAWPKHSQRLRGRAPLGSNHSPASMVPPVSLL